MAADPVTGYDPDDDLDLKNANDRFAAAGDEHKSAEATTALTTAAPAASAPQTSGLTHWMADLPQNVGSGLMSAALNTADAMHSGLRWIDNKATEAHAAMMGENPDELKREEDAQRNPLDVPEYSAVRSAVQNFKSKYVDVKNPTMSDTITQGVSQFAIPFLGWSKAVSGVGAVGRLAGMGRTLMAESATAGTAMAPGDGRFADMVELGKHTEGKFADVLNSITPDGSLLNNYLNYMTADRDSEGEWEARAKNIVDTVTGGAVISPLIHSGMTMLKGGMAGLKYSLENGVGSMDQLAIPNQEGRIGYHGTPHDFNVDTGFDDTKIGTGEGAQAYGYGHYLAENPDIAKGYQARLSQMNVPQTSPLGTAQRIMDSDPKMTPAKVVTELNRRAAASDDPNFRSRMLTAISQVKNGALDKARGSLLSADVDDAHADSMLDWDKPLSDQKPLPQPVQDELEKARQYAVANYGASVLDHPKVTGGEAYKVLSDHLGRTMEDEHLGESGNPRGWGYAFRGDHGQKAASDLLDAHGIPGIKYLDGSSRGGEEGTRNLVVFKGKNIKVTSKNGKPVTK